MIPIFLWRNSLRNNKGCCTKCGTKIIDSEGKPYENNIVIPINQQNSDLQDIICKTCTDKGRHYVLGTVRWTDNNVAELMRMYDGMDWDAATKLANAKVKLQSQEIRKNAELQSKIRRLEYENSALKGQVENLRNIREKERAERDKQICLLSKENTALEARLKKMERILAAKNL